MSKYQLTVGEFRDFVEESGYITDCEKKGGGHVFLVEIEMAIYAQNAFGFVENEKENG